MADLDKLYDKFCETITLPASKKNELVTGRNSLREDIRTDFSGKGRNKPSFCMQGSFAMRTVINPINGNEYDLDDGVYLNGYSDKDQDEWPSASSVHRWIVDAVDGHTNSAPENKTSCVRVRYARGYHIDLPSYIIDDEKCYLATKNDGWTESDPKAFKEWFMSYVTNYPISYGEPLRRTVKYMKAWRDYCDVDLASIVITILATKNFSCYSGRDDLAVLNTVKKIRSALNLSFSCRKPVYPYEELLVGYTAAEQKAILDALETFESTLSQASAESDEKKASETVRTVYGNRFPLGQSTTAGSTYAITTAPGVIGNDGRSA